jgi:hypothetical protein
MAVLTAMPLVYVHGVDGTVWKEVWGAARPGDAVWGGALGTAVGAWFGAVPIPLDWFVFPLPSFFILLSFPFFFLFSFFPSLLGGFRGMFVVIEDLY